MIKTLYGSVLTNPHEHTGYCSRGDRSTERGARGMPRLSVFKGEKRHSLSVSRSRAVVSLPLSLLAMSAVPRVPSPLVPPTVVVLPSLLGAVTISECPLSTVTLESSLSQRSLRASLSPSPPSLLLCTRSRRGRGGSRSRCTRRLWRTTTILCS